MSKLTFSSLGFRLVEQLPATSLFLSKELLPHLLLFQNFATLPKNTTSSFLHSNAHKWTTLTSLLFNFIISFYSLHYNHADQQWQRRFQHSLQLLRLHTKKTSSSSSKAPSARSMTSSPMVSVHQSSRSASSPGLEPNVSTCGSSS